VSLRGRGLDVETGRGRGLYAETGRGWRHNNAERGRGRGLKTISHNQLYSFNL